MAKTLEKSNVTKAEESTTVEVQSQSYALRYKEGRSLPVLATMPDDQPVSTNKYCGLGFVQCQRRKKELRQDNSWLLPHDNAPARPAPSIRQLLTEKDIAVHERPSLSHDWLHVIFFLTHLWTQVGPEGIFLKDVDDLKMALMWLGKLLKESFQEGMQRW